MTYFGDDLLRVSIAGITEQKALEVDWAAQGGLGALKVRRSSDQTFNQIQGFRFDPNPVRYALRVVAKMRLKNWGQDNEAEEERPKEDEEVSALPSDGRTQVANLFFLSFSCLGSVKEQSFAAMMKLLDMKGKRVPLTTMELIHSELQHMYFKQPNDAQKALEILAAHSAGRHLVMRLYFGGWEEDSVSGPKFAWNDFESLLDPEAFLSQGYGRIAMNGLYHLIFTLLVSASLKQGDIYEWNMTLDPLLLLFLIGQCAEEGKEFWTQPRYIRNFWNIVDVIVIVSLTMYYFFMSYEQIGRTSLSICVLFLVIRLLGILRNTQLWDLGQLIRTTVAMLMDLMSFMFMWLFIVGAFSAALHFLLSFEASQKCADSSTAPLNLTAANGGVGDDPEQMAIFAHFWSMCLWLFNASLGDFHFEALEASRYRLTAVAIFLLYLIVCMVTLLNFMIAILSSTFENYRSSSLELSILDLAVDSLEKPYQSNLAQPPWMPRPINLLNMATFTIFSIIKAPLRLDSPWVPTLDALRWEVHMCVMWLFGNLLMAFIVLLCRLVALFFLVSLLIVTSPVTTLVCLANVLNGEVSFAYGVYYRARTQSRTPQCSDHLWVVGDYLQSLRWEQMLCCAAPGVLILACMIYAMLTWFEDSELPRYLLISHEWMDDTLIHYFSGHTLERKPLWFQVVLHTQWFIFSLGAVWTIKEFLAPITLRFFLSCDRDRSNDVVSPIQAGWRNLRRRAEAMYQCQSDQTAYQPATRTRSLDATTGTNTQEESNWSDIEPTKSTVLAGGLRSSVRRPKGRSRNGTDYLGMDSEIVDDGGFVIMNISAMLEELLAPGQTQNLLLQALDIIYEGEQVQLYSFNFFAYYMCLDDWLWIACSVLWTERRNRTQLDLIPAERRRRLSPHQRQMLVGHPVFGNYLFEPHGPGLPEHGFFFEDWIQAACDGTMHQRHIRTIEILDHLDEYARTLSAALQEHEEFQLLQQEGAPIGT